ncbi:MAG TPA: RNA polymerase sigma factor [Candidatus Deferrimicrobiaceae bacterium]
MRTDEELMELYREGSRDAFEELYSRHHRRVIQFCYRMTGDRARAEEAAQEVFLRIARAASTYRPTAKFTTWMFTIARRATLNFLRDEKETGEKVPILHGAEREEIPGPVQVEGPADLDPERIAWSAQLREKFVLALQSLPETYRSAFVLNRGDGLSYEDVAAVLGITVQAVKSRIHRAREMLLRELSGILR